MPELELKFQIPARALAAVRRAALTAAARTSQPQARYFDSADRRLANAGLTLSLRLEDGVWVQALKGLGANAIRHVEHELRLAADMNPPCPDLARHAGTEACHLLCAALGKHPVALQEIFATELSRIRRRIRSGGAVVELTLDVGTLVAGGKVDIVRQPLCELAFELKSGPPSALFALAQRWALRHGLCLDVRSTAERGELLARGVLARAATRAVPPNLTRAMSADTALRVLVATCLQQVMPNLSALAAATGDAEHLHQARIGLRRLRSAIGLFAPWSATVDAGWDEGLAALFSQLGRQRDQDALAAGLLPELIAAGAPMAELAAPAPSASISELLRGTTHLPLLLGLLAFARGSETDATPTTITTASLKRRAAKALLSLRRKLQKASRHFDTMDDAERHHLRKRLKRLRYGIELTSPLFDTKNIRRELKALQPAQDALGHYHDLCVAEALFRSQAAHDPRAWFAVGWLTANRSTQAKVAGKALNRAMRKGAQGK